MTISSLKATIGGARVEIDEALVRRYDLSLPRYTSFPPADRWRSLDAGPYEAALRRCSEESANLSLYIHIPFCDARCSFCGCSSIATRNGEIKERYLDSCLRETKLVSNALGGGARVSGIHFGGGTPSSVGLLALGRLVEEVSRRIGIAAGAEIAIEIDPRVISPADLTTLCETGFNRFSFGVQDFDAAVGASIGRVADSGDVLRLMEAARLSNASVNFDLVYGLPRQNASSWSRTLARVVELSPDRIALFNFAYLPGRLPHQRSIDAASLPPPMEKLSLFASAVERFEEAGYSFIGLDHFARSGDSLAAAHREGKLTRNFQGYTATAGVPIVGVGATAIGEIGDVYAQNEKKLAAYLRKTQSGRLATFRGIILTPEEERARLAIRALLCSQRSRVESEEARRRLALLEDDGIVNLKGDEVLLTPLGRLFARQAAAALDPALDSKSSNYSKAV